MQLHKEEDRGKRALSALHVTQAMSLLGHRLPLAIHPIIQGVLDNDVLEEPGIHGSSQSQSGSPP